MSGLSGFLAPISWLGRQGTRAIAVSLFLGMALPPISAFAKPALPFAVFLLLVLAMIRIEPAALRPVGRYPVRIVAMMVWIMLAIPLIGGVIIASVGLIDAAPDLALAIILMLSAPPIMSVPAFCAILGLNSTLSLVLMVLSLIITPVAAPFTANLFVENALPLSPLDLATRLAFYLAGSAIVAAILRKVIGAAKVDASRNLFDGLNVIMLFIFAVALMDGVAGQAVANPLLVIGLVCLSFLVAGLIILTTAALFQNLGYRDALSIGLTAGNRNMGLMASALIAGLPDLTWTYIALAQFPIYFLPQIMRPLVKRFGLDHG